MNRASSRAAAALLAASALCLSSCSAGSSGEEPAESAERSAITVALTGEPTNLDFTTTAGAAIPQALMTNVYEGLVEIDQDGNIQPLLAQSWDISEDRRTYTFTLQPDRILFQRKANLPRSGNSGSSLLFLYRRTNRLPYRQEQASAHNPLPPP